jgi:hypothetical protein
VDGTRWEPCAIWEPQVSYVSHMEAMWAIWEMDGTIWDLLTQYGGHLGALCTIQEANGLWSQVVPDGSHMVSYGSCVS